MCNILWKQTNFLIIRNATRIWLHFLLLCRVYAWNLLTYKWVSWKQNSKETKQKYESLAKLLYMSLMIDEYTIHNLIQICRCQSNFAKNVHMYHTRILLLLFTHSIMLYVYKCWKCLIWTTQMGHMSKQRENIIMNKQFW